MCSYPTALLHHSALYCLRAIMRRFLPLLISVVGVLAAPSPTKAQQTPTFTRPTVTLRGGAVQTVNERVGGLAPYVEVQSRVHIGETPLGLALYGGVSYEQFSESRQLDCIVAPCPESESRDTHFDLATGIRVGLFPRNGPVDVFVGAASHLVHQRRTSTSSEDVRRWEQRATVEGGVNVRISVASRFSIEGGVLGFLPVHVGEGTPPAAADRLEVDMQRYGISLGVQYAL